MDIAKVIKFATKKHEGQTDKAGKPYILHPMRVALRLETEQEKIVALLHDVLEDTDATIEDLKRLDLDEDTINTIQILTKSTIITRRYYWRRK
jgi:(p)ppGpp synthase/HD superfamily hydrolase